MSSTSIEALLAQLLIEYCRETYNREEEDQVERKFVSLATQILKHYTIVPRDNMGRDMSTLQFVGRSMEKCEWLHAKNTTAELAMNQALRSLHFLQSVFKSGDPWTDTCQSMYSHAVKSLENAKDILCMDNPGFVTGTGFVVTTPPPEISERNAVSVGAVTTPAISEPLGEDAGDLTASREAHLAHMAKPSIWNKLSAHYAPSSSQGADKPPFTEEQLRGVPTEAMPRNDSSSLIESLINEKGASVFTAASELCGYFTTHNPGEAWPLVQKLNEALTALRQ